MTLELKTLASSSRICFQTLSNILVQLNIGSGTLYIWMILVGIKVLISCIFKLVISALNIGYCWACVFSKERYPWIVRGKMPTAFPSFVRVILLLLNLNIYLSKVNHFMSFALRIPFFIILKTLGILTSEHLPILSFEKF